MKQIPIRWSFLFLACSEPAPTPSSAPLDPGTTIQTNVEPAVSQGEAETPETIEEQPTSPAPLLNANALPPLTDGLVFHWTARSLKGIALQELRIQGNGNALHRLQETTQSEPVEWTFQMKTHDLDSLAAALASNDLCSQESTVTQALPDDGQTIFQLNFSKLKCNVWLFNSETRAQSVKRSLNIVRARIPKPPSQ